MKDNENSQDIEAELKAAIEFGMSDENNNAESDAFDPEENESEDHEVIDQEHENNEQLEQDLNENDDQTEKPLAHNEQLEPKVSRHRRSDDKSGEIDGEAKFDRKKQMTSRLNNTEIIIHGNLKQPIMAMTLGNLMDKLADLVKNPDQYLSQTPLFFSCLPLSEIVDSKAIKFSNDIHKDQLRDLYSLREKFENQFKKINSLILFTNNVNEIFSPESNHLPNEKFTLQSIKKSFFDTFIGMQHDWLQIMQE